MWNGMYSIIRDKKHFRAIVQWQNSGLLACHSRRGVVKWYPPASAMLKALRAGHGGLSQRHLPNQNLASARDPELVGKFS